jgi:hypothetical protein
MQTEWRADRFTPVRKEEDTYEIEIGSQGDCILDPFKCSWDLKVHRSLPASRRLGAEQLRTDLEPELAAVGENASGDNISAPFTRHTSGGVSVEYEIHVPRDSRLAIHHGTDSVSVSGVSGDIDASAGRGDILLWLPSGAYSLDARTKFGIVSPYLAGTAHNMGFGGITLKEILPERPGAGRPLSPVLYESLGSSLCLSQVFRPML